MTGPQRYRWLTRGEVYKYSAAVGKGLDDRRGQFCRVLILPKAGSKPANALVSFEDGTRHSVSTWSLRPNKRRP